MSVRNICCSSDQDELDDLQSPTDVSDDSIEVKVRSIPIRNKRKCTEPRHNPQPSLKKLKLCPVACGIGSKQFHPWYSRQQEEPLALVLRTHSADSYISLETVNHRELLSQRLPGGTSKEESNMLICASVSESAVSSRLSSLSYIHTTVESRPEEPHIPPALSPNTKKHTYLKVKDSVPQNDSVSSINQSDTSKAMFLSFENGFPKSGFIRYPLNSNENVRSHILLHKTIEASGFSNDCSKEVKRMLLQGMVVDQGVVPRIKVHNSLFNKPRKGRRAINATSNESPKTLKSIVYPLDVYPEKMNSQDQTIISHQDSSNAISVNQQSLFHTPSVSEPLTQPYNSQVKVKSLSVSDPGEDLGKNSGCNFSVESLLGNGEQVSETTAMKAAQRNYKNMTRERRIEANARERTRVHTISAAFDTLRHAIPAYSHNQKLSKLSVLRIACSYILTLSRIAGYDYSADQGQPTLPECIDAVSRTIQTEGKLRRKKDEQ